MIITISIIILWFVSQVKNSLFWIYLWQLKNYHIGRFKDYFRTKRGRSVFINPLYFLKIFSLFLFAFDFLTFLPLILILLEGFDRIINRKFIHPKKKKKYYFYSLLLF